MRFDLVLPTLVEQLPRSAGVALRRELSHAIERAVARDDQPALARLYRQLSLLLRSLRRDDEHGDPPEEITIQGKTATPQRRSSRPSSWRRPQAPICYPYGPVPPVSPSRHSDPVTSMPDSVLSADCRRRLDAYRRFMREKDGSGKQ